MATHGRQEGSRLAWAMDELELGWKLSPESQSTSPLLQTTHPPPSPGAPVIIQHLFLMKLSYNRVTQLAQIVVQHFLYVVVYSIYSWYHVCTLYTYLSIFPLTSCSGTMVNSTINELVVTPTGSPFSSVCIIGMISCLSLYSTIGATYDYIIETSIIIVMESWLKHEHCVLTCSFWRPDFCGFHSALSSTCWCSNLYV